MAITVGSNIGSLKAQRSVAEGSNALGRAFERLSSGRRINRASDDAAGIAVATQLNARSRIFSRGIQNINDGISLLSMADSTLEPLSGILTRLVELAEQAANGNYSYHQRKSLDAEGQVLSAEFFRVVQGTRFNGLGLFDGTLQGLLIQGGFGTDGGILSSLGGRLGTGTMASAVNSTLPAASSGVELGDLNGDGIADMVSSTTSANGVAVALGRGDGTFGPTTTIAADNGTSSLTLGDMNQDGILDIVTANTNADSVSIILGRGDGTFNVATNITVGDGPAEVKVGDLNQDGILDIATANAGAGGISILMGTGGGSFSAASNRTSGPLTYGLALGDLNGDGNLDIVTANTAGGTLSIFIGNGNGTFATPSDIVSSNITAKIELGDLNGDGSLDMILFDYFANTAYSMLGQGNGTFGSATALSGVASWRGKLGDLNGDGILDLATIDSGGPYSIRLGRGDGSFSTPTTTSLGAAGQAMALGDLNGDGVYDLLIAASTNAKGILGNTRDGINPLLSFSLRSQADALQALSRLKNKLEILNQQRGTIGAFQSRLSSALNNLHGQTLQFDSAVSRIIDADMAQESADSIRLQILQRAGIAVLSQANLQPQLAVTLLQ